MQGTKLDVLPCERSVLTGEKSNMLSTATEAGVTFGSWVVGLVVTKGFVASVSRGENWVASFRNIR